MVCAPLSVLPAGVRIIIMQLTNQGSAPITQQVHQSLSSFDKARARSVSSSSTVSENMDTYGPEVDYWLGSDEHAAGKQRIDWYSMMRCKSIDSSRNLNLLVADTS